MVRIQARMVVDAHAKYKHYGDGKKVQQILQLQ